MVFLVQKLVIIIGYDEHGNCSGEPSELKLAPMKLQWDFSPECIKDIDLAVADAQTLIADTDIRLMLFDDYGKGKFPWRIIYFIKNIS